MALFVTVDEEAFPLLHKGAVSLVGFFPFPDLPQLLPDSVQFSQKKPLDLAVKIGDLFQQGFDLPHQA